MENSVIPVSKNGKRRWDSEQKLAVLQEWQQGTPLAEVCRRHGLNANQVYRWKKALDHGLKEHGAFIPKSQVATLQRKIDELERVLGRKALEMDVLKKAFELKGLRFPEGI